MRELLVLGSPKSTPMTMFETSSNRHVISCPLRYTSAAEHPCTSTSPSHIFLVNQLGVLNRLRLRQTVAEGGIRELNRGRRFVKSTS